MVLVFAAGPNAGLFMTPAGMLPPTKPGMPAGMVPHDITAGPIASRSPDNVKRKQRNSSASRSRNSLKHMLDKLGLDFSEVSTIV